MLLSAGALPTSPETAEQLPRVLDELFDTFDADHSDSVDMTELASGLSLLCGGSRDEKIRAAFELYGACARVSRFARLLALLPGCHKWGGTLL